MLVQTLMCDLWHRRLRQLKRLIPILIFLSLVSVNAYKTGANTQKPPPVSISIGAVKQADADNCNWVVILFHIHFECI